MTDHADIIAANAALSAVEDTMRLEPDMTDSTRLWHLLRCIIEWCDAKGVDFDETVSEVREDYRQTHA